MVRKKLLNGDLLIRSVDSPFQFGEDLQWRSLPRQLAFFDKSRNHRRRNGLCVRAKMPKITRVERDLSSLAFDSGSGHTDDCVRPNHDCSNAYQVLSLTPSIEQVQDRFRLGGTRRSAQVRASSQENGQASEDEKSDLELFQGRIFLWGAPIILSDDKSRFLVQLRCL